MRFSFWFVLLLLCFGVAAIVDAQRFDAPRLGEPGPFNVGTAEYTIADETRPLTVTVWYPTDASQEDITYTIFPPFAIEGIAARGAPPAVTDTPYPLVVFSHGSSGSRVLGRFITEHLASYGFVVMAADHPGDDAQTNFLGESDFATNYALRPLDIHRQIDFAADTLNVDDDLLAGIVDTTNVGVIGHSFGGWTALAAAGGRLDFDQLETYCAGVNARRDNVCFVLALQDDIATARGLEATPTSVWDATNDPRIKALAAFAPWNAPILDVAEISAPTLIVVGDEDRTTPVERDAFAFYERLNTERSLLTFSLGGHSLFVDVCPEIFAQFSLQASCTDPVWDMERAHDITAHITTAFMLTHLLGDEDATAFLEANMVDFTGVIYERAN